MNPSPRSALVPGYVLGIVTGEAKVPTREWWDAAVAKVWDDFIAEMSSNPGYKGAYATWNVDKPGEVSIVGIWESIEHRLAYEARSATKVRAIFNALIVSPARTRLEIRRAD